MTKQIHRFSSLYQFIESFTEYGSLPALSYPEREITYTYATLQESVYTFASTLTRFCKPGDRILLDNLDQPHMVIALLGVMLTGAIAVPLESRMSENVKEAVSTLTTPILCISEKKQSNHRIKIYSFDTFTKKNLTKKMLQHITPDSPAEIIFTSGTWSNPKGVVLTHRNLLSNLSATLNSFTPNSGTTVLSLLPLSHALEQMCGLLVPLSEGCHIVYAAKIDSYSILGLLKKYPATYMVVVPKILEIFRSAIQKRLPKSRAFTLMYHLSARTPYPIRRILFRQLHDTFGSSLTTFIVGGAALNKDLESFFCTVGFKCIFGYGMSETSPVVSIAQSEHRSLNSVGYPILGIDVTIQNEEIVVSGASVSPGYWPLPKNLKQTIRHQIKTGDMGYRDSSGQLFVIGRKKHMIVFPTGDKILLEDIEQLVLENVLVQEACVLSYSENNILHMGLVYVGRIKSATLLREINTQLPPYAKLVRVMKWPEDTLPRSHTLKVQRHVVSRYWQVMI